MLVHSVSLEMLTFFVAFEAVAVTDVVEFVINHWSDRPEVFLNVHTLCFSVVSSLFIFACCL